MLIACFLIVINERLESFGNLCFALAFENFSARNIVDIVCTSILCFEGIAILAVFEAVEMANLHHHAYSNLDCFFQAGIQLYQKNDWNKKFIKLDQQDFLIEIFLRMSLNFSVFG